MRPGRSQAAFAVAALALTIVAVRVALVLAYANSVPWWEEWDALIDSLARKFAGGELTLRDLFEPNNEHTIFFTKLVYVTSLALNHGQFDNVPVALFDSLLAAGVWCVPTWLFLRRAPADTLWFSFLFAAIGTIPLGWVNALHGFQNQFYFMLLGVMPCLWLASDVDEFRPGRFAAFVLCALAAVISMGAGFLAPLTAAAILLLRGWHEPRRMRASVPGAAAGILIAMVGLWLFVHAEGHMVLETPGLAPGNNAPFWLARLFSCAAWPYGTSAVVGLLVSMPFCVFALRTALRGSVETVDWFVLGFGAWVAGQIAAMAIYRHISGEILPNRYVDVLAFWPLMNLYALVRLVARTSFARRLPVSWLTAAFGLAFAIAIAVQVPKSVDGLEGRSGWLANNARRVAGYVGGDGNAFEAPGFPPAPYWSVPRLKSLLDDPAIRDVLPPQLRMPLPLRPDPAAATAFVPGGVAPGVAAAYSPSYGSYAQSGERTTGAFRSLPMRSEWPYLVFDVAGGLPDAELALTLGDKRIRPHGDAGGDWRRVARRAPKGDFRVAAEDASATDWLAFTAPREAGRLSGTVAILAGHLCAHAALVIAMLAATVVLLLFAAFRYREAPRQRSTVR